jgi:hypothetical protein
MDYRANRGGVDHIAARGGVISDVPELSRFAPWDDRPYPARLAAGRLVRPAFPWQGKPGERSTSASTGRSIEEEREHARRAGRQASKGGRGHPCRSDKRPGFPLGSFYIGRSRAIDMSGPVGRACRDGDRLPPRRLHGGRTDWTLAWTEQFP